MNIKPSINKNISLQQPIKKENEKKYSKLELWSVLIVLILEEKDDLGIKITSYFN